MAVEVAPLGVAAEEAVVAPDEEAAAEVAPRDGVEVEVVAPPDAAVAEAEAPDGAEVAEPLPLTDVAAKVAEALPVALAPEWLRDAAAQVPGAPLSASAARAEAGVVAVRRVSPEHSTAAEAAAELRPRRRAAAPAAASVSKVRGRDGLPARAVRRVVVRDLRRLAAKRSAVGRQALLLHQVLRAVVAPPPRCVAA